MIFYLIWRKQIVLMGKELPACREKKKLNMNKTVIGGYEYDILPKRITAIN